MCGYGYSVYLWVVCVVCQSVGCDDRVLLEGLLVPTVRGVVGVLYRIGVVCVGVVSGPDVLVRELVLVGGVVLRARRVLRLGSEVVTSVVCVYMSSHSI